MKFRLLEEDKVFIYRDKNTGKMYTYDGTALREIKKGGGGGGGRPIDLPPDDSEKDKPEDEPGRKPDKPEEKPKKPEEPKEPKEPKEPWEPKEPKDPREPEEPKEPKKPKEPGEPKKKSDDSKKKPTEPGDPTEPGEPTEPDEPTEPGEPVEPPPEPTERSEHGEGGNFTIDQLDHILDEIDDLSKVWNDLTEEEKQYLRDKAHETDKATLEKEQEEREKEIEKEVEKLGDLHPGSEEAKSKLEEIGDLLNDDAVMNDLLDETERAVRKSRQERERERKEAEAATKMFTASEGLSDFVLDINKLIKSEVKKITKKDWGRFNKRTEGSGIYKPGKSTRKNPNVPRLFVYYDYSGSWGYDDIEVGNAAISTLRSVYEKKGLLTIETYFFAHDLGTTPAGAGTREIECFDKVYNHIKERKPDNVMIMTDSDGDYRGYLDITKLDIRDPIYVPGGMFILFRRGRVSKQVARVFRGKKLSKIYRF